MFKLLGDVMFLVGFCIPRRTGAETISTATMRMTEPTSIPSRPNLHLLSLHHYVNRNGEKNQGYISKNLVSPNMRRLVPPRVSLCSVIDSQFTEEPLRYGVVYI